MDDIRKKILVVDDDDFQSSVTMATLNGKYDIVTARSGEEAIKYFLKGNFPDLVLLDIVMPDIDGWETFNRLTGLGLLKDIPVAFFTSVEEASQRKDAFELGAADYIIKTSTREEIVNRINNLLQSAKKKD